MGSMQAIRIVVPGRPVPKQRPRLGVRMRGRRMVEAHVYTPRETRQYEEHVRECAWAAGAKPLEGDVVLEIDAWFRGRHPDGDNILKSVADALKEVAYRDDRQVVKWVCRIHKAKNRDEERAEIVVRPATEADRHAG